MLQRAANLAQSIDDLRVDGNDQREDGARPDWRIAYDLGSALCSTFDEMATGVIDKLRNELIPLMEQFYSDVGEMPIK